MVVDSIVTHDIEQVQIESIERQPSKGFDDFAVRMTRTRTRGKKRKPSTERRTFRRNPVSALGAFTSWPKKWSDGLRTEVEARLNEALG